MNNKFLTRQVLPEVEISINLNGITISSARLTPARFVPYDIGGKCRECKSTEAEVDFVVTKDGITIYCTRISGTRYVPFDSTYDLPGICFFRVKNKGRVFNIPYGSVKPEHPSPPPPPPTQKDLQNTTSEKQNKSNHSKSSQKFTKHTIENILKDKSKENNENVLLNEFFDSLDAATSGLPSQSDKVNNLKKQADKMEEEEMVAIEALYNIPR
ncbi:unnamed protein product [Meloidogyne enterolobii]|uniref:Uncharacterized protein n=2 Tax=Meloidogyne enterolobii TaxID=390850 RepID=A0A6V7TYQ7_MELEN|nr:unnamed protein product [Meloidogyne enterolobii]